MKRFLAFAIFCLAISQISAQLEKPKESKKWFESISLRGYTQIRYNGLFATNPDLGCEQCDKSWG